VSKLGSLLSKTASWIRWITEQPARAKTQVPTYVRIIGTPQYTDPPPPTYVYNVNREILDQDHQPILKVMFVMETYTPPTPTGNCTSLPVQAGDANSNEGGIFFDQFSLQAGAPQGCSSESIQSFKVRLNGKDFPITTKYKITWTFNGVTVVEQ
jgi:hypothetical protein